MELGILHNSPPSTKRGYRAGRLHRLWHGLPPAPWPCTRSQHHSVPSRNLHPLMVPPFLQPHPDLQSAVGNAPLSSKHPAQLPTTDCLLSIISPMGGQPSDAPALSPPSPLQQGGQSSNAPALSPPSPLPQGGQPIALALSPPSPPPQGGQPSDAPGLSPSSSTLLLCPSDSTLNICHLNSQSAVKTARHATSHHPPTRRHPHSDDRLNDGSPQAAANRQRQIGRCGRKNCEPVINLTEIWTGGIPESSKLASSPVYRVTDDLATPTLDCKLDVRVLCPSLAAPHQGAPSFDLDMLENFLFGDSFKEDDVNILTHTGEGGGGPPHFCHTTPPPPHPTPTTTHHHHHPSTTTTTTYTHGAPPPSPPDSSDEMITTSQTPPDDKEGFFGHPLTKATIAIEGGGGDRDERRGGTGEEGASGEALLHEFLNLPAMDRQGVKIKDRGGLPGIIHAEAEAGRDGGVCVRSMQKRTEEAEEEEETNGGDNVDYMKMFLEQATDSLENMDHLLGLHQGAGAEAEVPLPLSDPTSSEDLALPVKVKLEDTGGGGGADSTLQKTPLTSGGAGIGTQPLKGAARRPSREGERGDQKGESDPGGSLHVHGQARGGSSGSCRRRTPINAIPPPPSSSTPNPSPASCPASPSSTTTTTTTTPLLPPQSPAVSVPSPSAVSSPQAVPTSALPPGLVTTCQTGVAAGVRTTGVNCMSSFVPAPSAAAAAASASESVLLVPLAHSTVLTVDHDTSAILLPSVTTTTTAGNSHHNHTIASSESPDSSTSSTPHPDLSEPPVKQTTKDKLKLRIAQTAMTQPLLDTHQQHQQQQQQQHHQQQTVDAASHHLNQQQYQKSVLHPDPHTTFQQQYSLNQQLQQQQQQIQQQQQQLQQTPSPREALAYLAEDDLAVMNGKFGNTGGLPHIKREDQFLDYDAPFPPPYNSSGMQVLYNPLPSSSPSSSSATAAAVAGLVSMVTSGDSPSAGLSEADLLSQMSSEPVLVQSQFLHLLQPLDIGQPTPQQHQHQHQQQQHQQQLNNGYYNPSDNLYIYTNNNNNNSNNNPLGKAADGGLLDLDTEKSVLQYVQQQQQQQHLQDHYGYGGGFQQYMNAGVAVDTSPDSGIGHDPGLSPNAAVLSLKETALAGTDGHGMKEGKSLKRRKSSQNPVLTRQFSSGSDKLLPRNPAIQKLEVNSTGYQYCLDAPISTTQRVEEDKVTYLNKSQYYPLVLENVTPERVPKGVLCKTVIMLVFRDEKSKEEESKAWQFWHSRQHSYKQRILDIDTKNSQGVGPNSISELAFNAVCVKWNPRDGQVRVSIAVHCLSTDFSNQKGVKGIPLHIQCDTYELFDCKKELLPCHRAYCQIKVFCDKGAERKTRDEERRRTAKTTKPEATGFSPGRRRTDEVFHSPCERSSSSSSSPSSSSSSSSCQFIVCVAVWLSAGRRRTDEVFHSPCERSDFYNMADLSTTPVFFSPSYATGEFTHNENVSLRDDDESSQPSPTQSGDQSDDVSMAKMPRLTSCSSCNKHLTPLMYVKENSDKAYHAIHLEVPTVDELLKAISHKFNKQLGTVTNFFKKSKKGILVRMDDNIVRHYSHETAFLLEVTPVGEEEVDVVLVETYQ
ncbi:hypothetical protein ACOMHN_037223 [Nucella lapillus]